MRIQRVTVLLLALLLPVIAMAQNVIVTRHFSGNWDQPEQESHGIILQIVNQISGVKRAVAYWLTYDDEQTASWLIAVGPVSGNRIEMDLFKASGVTFLEANRPGDANVVQIGTMDMEFSSCNEEGRSPDTHIPSNFLQRLSQFYPIGLRVLSSHCTYAGTQISLGVN